MSSPSEGPAVRLRGVSKRFASYHRRATSLKERLVRREESEGDVFWALRDVDLVVRRGETVDLSPDDARRLGVRDGQRVRVASRRGAVVAPVRIDDGLPAGTVFMTFHFPEQVDTNVLTIDATDPKAGTAEFKAAAVRIDKIDTIDPSQTVAGAAAGE